MTENSVTGGGEITLVEAVRTRRSVRGFIPREVPRSVIEEILALASRAPSGSNNQPWRIYVVSGHARDALVKKVSAAFDASLDGVGACDFEDSYDYYPEKWVSPYLERRRENGWGLYGVLGIERGETRRMNLQRGRNYKLFDAPVGIFLTIDRALARGALLDAGMFVQTMLLAARRYGLHTCPQAAWLHYHSLVLPHVGASESEMLVCGVALGFADEGAVVNTFQTPREPVANFTKWVE